LWRREDRKNRSELKRQAIAHGANSNRICWLSSLLSPRPLSCSRRRKSARSLDPMPQHSCQQTSVVGPQRVSQWQFAATIPELHDRQLKPKE
jgi:hypothetical protein